MRVIKKGSDYLNWTKVVICSEELSRLGDEDMESCGTEFEIDENDVLRFYWLGNFGGKHYYPAVKCPVCEKVLYVKEIPRLVIQRIIKHKEAGWDGWQDN